MGEWVYKATGAMASYEDTMDLAIWDHFLCRSAFQIERGKEVRAARVAEVRAGDTLHYYYRKQDGKVGWFGSFVIQGPAEWGPGFDAVPGHEPLAAVDEHAARPKMLARLTRGGYEPDPKLERFMGWVLKKIPGKEPPKFDQDRLFPGPNQGLWHYPDAELPRPKKSRTAR